MDLKIEIAARAATWKLPFRQVLGKAGRLGLDGLELDATGELTPRALSQTARRDIARSLSSNLLRPAGLYCVMRHGLDVPDRQESRIEYVKDVLAMSAEMAAGPVIVQPGRIPHGDAAAEDRWLIDAVNALVRHGDRLGATLTLESGTETSAALAAFVARFDTAALAVCYDPGSTYQNGFDPIDSVGDLRGWIRHVHARDARRTAPRRAQTVPLGEGDVDWMSLHGALTAINYQGWFVIDEPLDRVESSVSLLRRVS